MFWTFMENVDPATGGRPSESEEPPTAGYPLAEDMSNDAVASSLHPTGLQRVPTSTCKTKQPRCVLQS